MAAESRTRDLRTRDKTRPPGARGIGGVEEIYTYTGRAHVSACVSNPTNRITYRIEQISNPEYYWPFAGNHPFRCLKAREWETAVRHAD